jgi:hypothetical protein
VAPGYFYDPDPDNGNTITIRYRTAYAEPTANDYRYYSTSCTGYNYTDYDEQCAREKEARRRWLLFTRGRGWSEAFPVARPSKGYRPVRSTRLVPTKCPARRPTRNVRWSTLKQLRRRGLI